MTVENTNQVLEWAYAISQPIAIVLVAFISAFLANFLAVRRLRKETKESLQKSKYEKILQANQKAWSLLGYITDKENVKSVYTMTQKNGKDTYFIQKNNAELFIKDYAEFIFAEGYGLFLSQQTIALLAKARGIIYGFLLKEKDNKENCIKVDNEDLIKSIRRIYNGLISEIRDAVVINEERKLPKK